MLRNTIAMSVFYSVTCKAHCKRNEKTLDLSPDDKIIKTVHTVIFTSLSHSFAFCND